ncbi:MAG: membrane protein insertase YidC [Treponema sp.]|nr:membrane protein insertase YidC [Treponema sp.]
MLYNLIISPIELLINWVFIFISNNFNQYGIFISILGVSLAMNFMALPIYNIADKIQEKERNISLKLSKQVKRIKETFKGDEQFMMLQAYYKEEHYHPLYVFRSSLSILIEIPFFIAAYHYLSNCEALSGSSFWIFKNLGEPDNFFKIPIGSKFFFINILPILMTLINFVSGAIYTKGAPIKEKIQLYGVAIVFLVLLYNSPSGLVIYWILNNLFSLAKNIVMKTKNPKKILHIIISCILLSISTFFLIHPGNILKRLAVFLFAIIVAIIPLIKKFLNKFLKQEKENNIINLEKSDKTTLLILLLSGLGLSLLTGLLLPSNVIASSPTEFSFLGTHENPLFFVFNSFSVFTGLFLFWPLIIFKLFDQKVKKTETFIFFILFFVALANALFFKHEYGTLSITFNISNGRILRKTSLFLKIVPFIFTTIIIVGYIIISKTKHQKILIMLNSILCITLLILSSVNINKINKGFKELAISKAEQKNPDDNDSLLVKKDIHLSKTNKNVMILFMDRAIGCYFPYFLEQFPEYKKSFDGFTEFTNAISSGEWTIAGAPPIMGGYEYTPENMNNRDDILLVDKHNEASILLPTLFEEKGFHSTIINPPWPNYKFASEQDYSAFKELKNTTVLNLNGVYSDKYSNKFNLNDNTDIICKKEIINFSVIQILFPILRNTFYGNFRLALDDIKSFIDSYSPLYYINEETDFESNEPNYIFIDNEACHNSCYIDDSFSFPTYNKTEKTGSYKPATDFEIQLYQSFCISFKQLALFFDYLRENEVWDNTRIIIVSDHGYHTQMGYYKDTFKRSAIPEAQYDFTFSDQIPNSFDCILLFKDFNKNSPITRDDTFMTNADTVLLAIDDLDIKKVNPFTSKPLEAQKEDGINLLFRNHNILQINAPEVRDQTTITYNIKNSWHYNGKGINNPNNWIPLNKYNQSK